MPGENISINISGEKLRMIMIYSKRAYWFSTTKGQFTTHYQTLGPIGHRHSPCSRTWRSIWITLGYTTITWNMFYFLYEFWARFYLDVELGDLEGTSSLAQTRIVPSVWPDKRILGLSHSRPAGAATHVTPSMLTEPEISIQLRYVIVT